jgi:alternate signal-mediated exported protein
MELAIRKESGVRSMLTAMKEQRWMLFLACVVLSILLMVGSTFAWFFVRESVTNSLKAPDLPFEFSLGEEFMPPGGVAPGDAVRKVVSVTNTGDLPGFARVMVNPEIMSKADPDTGMGTVLPYTPDVLTYYYEEDPDNPGFPKADAMGMNPEWMDGGDGYYYYPVKLMPGETTPPLFMFVELAEDLGDEYDGAGLAIDVKVEAVETARYRDAWWPGSDGKGMVPAPTTALEEIDGLLQDQL